MIQICVSLTEESSAGVVERMAELSEVADLVEVRGDLVRDLDLLRILRSRSVPVLFTCRPASEGGAFDDEAGERRRHLLLEAVKRGFDYVDVELRSGFAEVMAEKAGRGLVVSHHDLAGTPDDLDGLYARMCETGADVVKIVTSPSSVSEVGRLLAFAARAAAGGGAPLVAIAMGPLGAISRLVAGRTGAPFTFASAQAGAEAAPGQIPADLMADLYRVRQVGASTRVFGILGQGVSRSLSPVIHNRAFAAASIDAIYVPLEAEALAPFMAALPDLGLAGFSVTRPYKVEILQYLQEVDETAALCGSVNTVIVHNGTLQGSTTDGIGVVAPLKKRLELRGRRVAIVGAGGAARAAALALTKRGCRVTVLARNPEQAASVAAAVGCASGDLAEIEGLEHEVLVNATPVGSPAAPEALPLPARALRPGTIVLDMVYDPLETRLMREARAAGCTAIGGIEMLVAQAVAQFEAWTGLEAPTDVMREAALTVAQGREQRALP